MNKESITYIDAHTHLNFSAFDTDRDVVIQDMKDRGVYAINVGTQKDTSMQAVALAEQYDNLFAIVGLHPIHTGKSFHDTAELGIGGSEFTSRGEVFDSAFYKELASHERVVGIGECGLDYFHLEEGTKKVQGQSFVEQLTVAQELDKPVMLHIREAYDDALAIIRQFPGIRGNVHFFAGTKEIAQQFLDLGFTLSFTGVITFAKEYEDMVKYVPLDRILSETDAPFVSPKPFRGKRNSPLMVPYVVECMASLKGVSVTEMARKIQENAEKLFNIKLV